PRPRDPRGRVQHDREERPVGGAVRDGRDGPVRLVGRPARAGGGQTMSVDALTPFGRYRLIRQIGRGGEATVHLAEDPVLHRSVALKVFPPALGAGPAEPPAGFRNEVDALSRLDHPGICAFHEAGIEQGCAYIAMSYVEG